MRPTLVWPSRTNAGSASARYFLRHPQGPQTAPVSERLPPCPARAAITSVPVPGFRAVRVAQVRPRPSLIDLALSISARPTAYYAARNTCSIDIQRPEPPARRGVPVVDPRAHRLRGGIRQPPPHVLRHPAARGRGLGLAQRPGILFRNQHRRGKSLLQQAPDEPLNREIGHSHRRPVLFRERRFHHLALDFPRQQGPRAHRLHRKLDFRIRIINHMAACPFMALVMRDDTMRDPAAA